MSRPFFSTPERIAALVTEAARWPGTPFAEYGAVAGPKGGASCHCLVAAVLRGAGWDIDEELPRYKPGHARMHNDGVMLPWLRARPERLEEQTPLDISAAQPGDIIVAELGLCSHHMGVVIDGGRVLNTLARGGARYTGLGDPLLAARIRAQFRPLEAAS